MSRLIDADKLIEELNNMPYIKGRYDKVNANEHFIFGCETVYEIVINKLEEQPTAFDVDKVIEKIDKDINWYQFLKDNLKCNGTVITSDRGVITTKQAILQNVKDIVKTGGRDDR